MVYTVYARALDGACTLQWTVSEECVARSMVLAFRAKGATAWYTLERFPMYLDA